MSFFDDRRHAGRVLASELAPYMDRDDVVVLALPRGGVPVAYEVARRLEAPLDVFVVRKLGVPGQEELAMGALASGGVHVLNPEVVFGLRIPDSTMDAIVASERRELERRERVYRGKRPPLDVRDRVAILVDDGLATGATMRAAVLGLRQRAPAGIVVAVPIAPRSACRDLQPVADQVVCAITSDHFEAVSPWYADFTQTSDEEVRALLEEAAWEMESRSPALPTASRGA